MSRFVPLAFAAAVMTVVSASPEAPRAAEARWSWADWQAERTSHRQTCRHFDNRARFLPRDAEPVFLAAAADACAAALEAVRVGASAGKPAETARAAEASELLERLTALRLEVSSINSQRVYGAQSGARAFPKAGPGGTLSVVTATGEYLIARMMGVPQALAAWRAGPSGAPEDMAAATPAQPARPGEAR